MLDAGGPAEKQGDAQVHGGVAQQSRRVEDSCTKESWTGKKIEIEPQRPPAGYSKGEQETCHSKHGRGE